MIFVATALFLPNLSSSQSPALELRERELLVRLAPQPSGPAPEELVESVRSGRSPALPSIAGEAVSARPLIAERPPADVQLQADPASPSARLLRWVVLTYPPGTDLDAVAAELAADPRVEIAEPNRRASFSAVTPNDTWFPQQWGTFSLNLPNAWERTKGHGFVGLIDTGLDVDHEDLRPFDPITGGYDGGNFRPHLSWDFSTPATCTGDGACVDEAEPGDASNRCGAGHGTHTSGIVGATADNGIGVTGDCWGCALMMARSGSISTTEVSAALHWLADHGAQAVSMSFGWTSTQAAVADALEYASERDLLLSASVGNDLADIEFPAFHPAVIAAGGTEPPAGTVNFWQRDVCPSAMGQLETCPGHFANWPGNIECGSNYTVTPGSPMVELVAPAADVLSTFYVGGGWNIGLGCHDGGFAAPGYDYCTGTSMSSPHLAAVATLVRSVHPLVSQQDVRTILRDSASGGGVWDPQLGYGAPDAAAAADAMLGVAFGQVLANRLTPLFVLYSFDAEAHLETTIPQRASAAILDPSTSYDSWSLLAPPVGGYTAFPGAPCQISPCTREPVAWVHLFTTDREPFPGSPELVPLYRLSYDQAFGGNPDNQSFAYTTEAAGIEAFAGVGYRLDGIEGYIYERCTPEPSCIPSGATRLYRMYNTALDDYVVIPESKVADFQADGYVFQAGLNDWIGYVYENVDSDFDFLIDGFEGLIGTDPGDFDSDGDGVGDGEEVLEYPFSDPLDPPSCSSIFADGFDSGDFGAWFDTVTQSQGSLAVDAGSAMEGAFGMEASIPGWQDRAFVRDLSPAGESVYRARFLFRFDATMAEGNLHRIFVAQDDSVPTNVAMVRMRMNGGQFQLSGWARRADLTWAVTPWITVSPNQVLEIELFWRAATVQASGRLELSVNGQLQSVTGVANDGFAIDRIQLGVVNGVDSGTAGTFDFDGFESCDQ